jgi:hypothetical protein
MIHQYVIVTLTHVGPSALLAVHLRAAAAPQAGQPSRQQARGASLALHLPSARLHPLPSLAPPPLPRCRFRLGRQEDSHEYLRCLLDAMHEALLRPFKPKPAPELAQTTLIYRIFGGRLRSQIRCEGGARRSCCCPCCCSLACTAPGRQGSAGCSPVAPGGASQLLTWRDCRLLQAWRTSPTPLTPSWTSLSR